MANAVARCHGITKIYEDRRELCQICLRLRRYSLGWAHAMAGYQGETNICESHGELCQIYVPYWRYRREWPTLWLVAIVGQTCEQTAESSARLTRNMRDMNEAGPTLWLVAIGEPRCEQTAESSTRSAKDLRDV